MHHTRLIYLFSISLLLSPACLASTDGSHINITADLPYVDLMHDGKSVRIQRVQDTSNIIDLDYALTSRECPPYCIQPMRLAEGVETIGELELLDYLQQRSTGRSDILVIDSREAMWLSKGMIPGAQHIPWTRLYYQTAKQKDIVELLSFEFGAVQLGSLWNFENAKTLVFYCNGPWCGQSPTNIRALLNLGYPAHKLKWYRGGIQAWKAFGLTTVTPD